MIEVFKARNARGKIEMRLRPDFLVQFYQGPLSQAG